MHASLALMRMAFGGSGWQTPKYAPLLLPPRNPGNFLEPLLGLLGFTRGLGTNYPFTRLSGAFPAAEGYTLPSCAHDSWTLPATRQDATLDMPQAQSSGNARCAPLPINLATDQLPPLSLWQLEPWRLAGSAPFMGSISPATDCSGLFPESSLF